MTRAVTAMLVVAVFVASLAACDSPTDNGVNAAILNLRDGVVRLLASDSAQLQVELRDADYQLTSGRVTWFTLHPAIAMIDANGTLRAQQPGWTMAYAMHGSMIDSAWVGVTARYEAISVGRDVACAFTADAHHMHCWGVSNTMLAFSGSAYTPAFVTAAANQSALGWDHGCRLHHDGTVLCWGTDRYGQRGDGGPRAQLGQPPSQVLTPQTLVTIDASQYHTCGTSADERVFCWGINDTGELGVPPDSTPEYPQICDNHPCSPLPIEVPGMRLRMVSAGLEHTCGLDAQGKAFCWGRNETGQLGIGFIGQVLAPRAVETSLRFKTIDAGWSRTCAISVDDDLYCWGQNVSLPARLAPPLKFKAVSTFRSHCAVTTASVLLCQSGDTLAQSIPGVDFADVEVNNNAGCALSTRGAVFCWGNVKGHGGYGRDQTTMVAPPGPLPARVTQ